MRRSNRKFWRMFGWVAALSIVLIAWQSNYPAAANNAVRKLPYIDVIEHVSVFNKTIDKNIHGRLNNRVFGQSTFDPTVYVLDCLGLNYSCRLEFIRPIVGNVVRQEFADITTQDYFVNRRRRTAEVFEGQQDVDSCCVSFVDCGRAGRSTVTMHFGANHHRSAEVFDINVRSLKTNEHLFHQLSLLGRCSRLINGGFNGTSCLYSFTKDVGVVAPSLALVSYSLGFSGSPKFLGRAPESVSEGGYGNAGQSRDTSAVFIKDVPKPLQKSKGGFVSGAIFIFGMALLAGLIIYHSGRDENRPIERKHDDK